ncbi:hypothetical protein GOBAR_AA11901 [Gossypium barbadense]|uniref:DUF4220 domain-containing protein n=1 Tax=Gossypium barbadense TaxID=3634 RepID=A0A2P5XZE6_GOSBA|nr:hypothetical protein GOBAR_AA11901 [Gossypium barbadense]
MYVSLNLQSRYGVDVAISLLFVEVKDSVLRRVFSEIVKKFWSKWELRSMVTLSLVLQFLLVYFGRKRKKYTGNWVPLIAVIAWLIYLSSDWMATLVLSTLLRGSYELKEGLIVFWTPFLLWHLGSPYNITAYSLEDNELWLRHFLGMFFQIGEAIYIYVKFQSNTALNAMAIPLFIGGVLKYLERIWALRCANPKQLMKYFYSAPKTENLSSSDSVRSEMREMIRTGLFDPSKKRDFIGNSMITSEVRFLRKVDSACDVFKPLFTDLPFQISKEFHDEMVYLNPGTRTAAEAFNFVKIELEFLYDLLYTKNPIQHRHHIVSLALRCFCFFSLLSVLVAFSVLYPENEDSTVDVVVTYMLLLGAVWLESYSFYMHIRSKWTILRYDVREDKMRKLYHRLVQNRLHVIKSKEGIRKMAQHDLLEYCVKAKASQFAQILKFIDPGDLLQKFWYATWKEVDIELKKFIYNHLNEKRSKFEKGRFKLECLQKILAERGDNVLQEKGFDLDDKDEYWKLKTTDFPRQIFVWHIATSLVYYNDLSKHRRSMLINLAWFSDIVNKETYQQTKRISPKKNMKVSMEKFSDALLSFEFNEFSEIGALWDGIKFARQLQSLVREERWDHEEKWKMISEVWMEMMIYGASRCTWEEHAQQLRHGGELLTHVALIMAHLGLTTQVQRFEKPADQASASAFATPF